MKNKTVIFLYFIVIAMILRDTFFLRARDPNDYASVDASSLIQIGLICAAFAGVFSSNGFYTLKIILRGPLKFLYIYLVWCMFSSIWSSSIVYTLYRTFELGVIFLLIAHIIRKINNFYLTIKYFQLFLIISIFGALGYYIKNNTFTLAFLHTNTYSYFGAIGVISSIGLFKIKSEKKSNKLLLIFCLAVSMLAIVLGTSSASNISLLCGLMVLMYTKTKSLVSKFIFIIIIIVAATYGDVILANSMEYIFPNKKLENIQNMTGRTAMWEHYLRGFLERPLTGYGFPSGEKEGARFGWYTTSSSHNMIISVAINTGIIGLITFGLFLFKSGLVLYNGIKKNRDNFSWIFACWFASLINAMSMPLIGSHWTWTTTGFAWILLMGLLYNNKPQIIKAKKIV